MPLIRATAVARGILAAFKSDTVNVCIQNVDYTVDGLVCKVEDLVESGCHKEAQIQNKHGLSSVRQGRGRMIYRMMSIRFAPSTVVASIKIRADSQDCRKVYDGIPSEASPAFREEQHPPYRPLIRHKIYRVESETIP